jgi:hypothetical protein
MTRLTNIKSRLAAATEGPWRGDCHDGSLKYHLYGADDSVVLTVDHKNGDYGFGDEADAVFVIHAPTDIAWLVKRVEHLERVLDQPLEPGCSGKPRLSANAGGGPTNRGQLAGELGYCRPGYQWSWGSGPHPAQSRGVGDDSLHRSHQALGAAAIVPVRLPPWRPESAREGQAAAAYALDVVENYRADIRDLIDEHGPREESGENTRPPI